ncbi:hypothetical protein [Hymenobacter canadensis]|uniref:Uncharacterized protein n=1 Tax=Hymenobacter canadensis TaxID=2999067 RepID=A0ABY7LU13_9BACT|nr:hypothetical protein [Hymenobacter canadensis]WBA42976.1 hypothetical protein O3303_05280 [Hymenobacter canadensis]
MHLSELTHWLAAPADFAQGAALYAQLGHSPVYRQLFALGETSYSRQLLERELQALASDPAPVTIAPPPAAATLPPTQAHTDAPELLPLRARLRGLRDERSQLHAQLTAPRLSEKDRGRFALRILVLGDQVQQLLQLEEHVLRQGALPPGPVVLADIDDQGELRRRLDNLVATRSKVRKNARRAAELPALEADITLIRLKLTPTTRV